MTSKEITHQKTMEKLMELLSKEKMRFKVEVQIKTGVVTKVYITKGLEDLETYIKQDFPKGKIISIIGGGVE